MAPDVSVVIAAYNAMPYVTRALESLTGQTIGLERLEIIAVDDGSTDGTGDELDRFATLYPTAMRVVHQSNSGGAAAPRNVALDLARGRYVFILDADDYLGSEALERMVAVADEQGTDVVMGKMVGVGGRKVPQRMFRRTQLHTDVLTSNAFWTVNPIKLFRRELIERLKLRFDTDLRMGEDQPFVASAYFNASGISILADYDYVYWVHREDGQNLTKTVLDFESSLPSLEAMFSILASHVPPGTNRDRLASRLFEYEMMQTTLERAPAEPDAAILRHGLDTARSWLDRYYSPGVALRLPPYHRVCYHLIGNGLYDEALTLLTLPAQFRDAPLVRRDGHAYVALPYFGDESLGVPDSAYQVTERLRHSWRLNGVRWAQGMLCIDFAASLEPFEAGEVSASLHLRHRGGDEDFVIPAQQIQADLARAADEPFTAHFTATFDPSRMADGQPLGMGRWDLWLVLEAGDARRNIRLDHESVVAARNQLSPGFCMPQGLPQRVVAPYLTEKARALALHVTPPAGTLAPYVRFDPVAASGMRSSELVISGSFTAHNLPRALQLKLDGPRTAWLPVRVTGDGEPLSFEVRVDAGTALDGSPLVDGGWKISLHAGTQSLDLAVAVPCPRPIDVGTWWTGFRRVKMTAKPTQRGKLRLTMRSTSLAGLVVATLRRALPST